MRLLFISLGCDKNLVDSEEMLGILRDRGHTFTDDETLAEGIVINTCCFIGMQRRKASRRFWIWQNTKKPGAAGH